MSEVDLRQTLEELDENGYQRIMDLRAYQRALLDELGVESHTALDFVLKEEEEVPPEEIDFFMIDDEEWLKDQVERASEKMYQHWTDYRERVDRIEEHWDDYLEDWERYQQDDIDLQHFEIYGEEPEDFGEEPEVRHQTTLRMYRSVTRDRETLQQNLARMTDEPYSGPLDKVAEKV